MIKATIVDGKPKLTAEFVIAIQDELTNAIRSVDSDATFDGTDNQQLAKAIQKLAYWGGSPLTFTLKNNNRLSLRGLEVDGSKYRSISFIAHGVGKSVHGVLNRVTMQVLSYNPYSKRWSLHCYEFSGSSRLFYLNLSDGPELVCEVPNICPESFEGQLTLSQIKYVGN